MGYSDNKDEKSKYNVENLDRMITNKSSKFYICGPSGFIDDTIKYLNDIGILNMYFMNILDLHLRFHRYIILPCTKFINVILCTCSSKSKLIHCMRETVDDAIFE